MKHFTINNETNNITAYGSAKEADAAPNSERFSNEGALVRLATTWPAARLVEIWNSLPGETPVKKFKDRATGVGRIWNAIQNLAVSESETPVESELTTELVIPAGTGAEADSATEEIIDALAATAPGIRATNVAPQDAHVATDAPSSGDTATPPENAPAEPAINKAECDRLLRIAAETQTAYWSALRDLEQSIGFEIDDPGDLREATVDELLERRKPVRKPRVRVATEGTKAPRENSKTNQVIAMLKRPEGTTLEEIMSAMKWLKHTTRSMLSAGGSLVKNHGLVITSETVGETKRYFIKS